jgi:hypothetical protein
VSPTVFQEGSVKVTVYREVGKKHHLPHCHVQIGDDSQVVVALPTLTPIVGGDLPRSVRALLEVHLDEIVEMWDECNR